jgi:GT2 family glycosyltransferase
MSRLAELTPIIVGLTLNYRDAERTRRCVQSLLDDGAAHVLVWDNSADGGACAAALCHAWAVESRVSIEESSMNLGFAAGVNRGIDWIRTHYPGAWIFLINNDATVLPGALSVLHATLIASPQAILAYPDIDHGGRVLGAVYYQRWFALITITALPGSFPYPSGCALIFAPERWPALLFDEDFFMYGEDAFLGWTHRNSGRLAYTPGVWVKHEGSVSSRMASRFYEARLVASHLVIARKIACSRPDFTVLMLGRVLSLGARAVVRAARYRSLVPIGALRAGWGLARDRPG